jgi:hypothetical protein
MDRSSLVGRPFQGNGHAADAKAAAILCTLFGSGIREKSVRFVVQRVRTLLDRWIVESIANGRP